jgi:hypothetical protein
VVFIIFCSITGTGATNNALRFSCRTLFVGAPKHSTGGRPLNRSGSGIHVIHVRNRSAGHHTNMTGTTAANDTIHGGDDHQPLGVEHPWIYQFVDIIYVGTIFNVSWLIEHCGSGIGVFGVTFCYFAIMYSSRLAFDEYYCISRAKGVIHLLAFCVYGAGVFVMAASINANPNHDNGMHHADPDDTVGNLGSHEDYDYGHCTRRTTYDVGFACGFITTRLVLIIMYVLYFRVFHKSNLLEHIVHPSTNGPLAARGTNTDTNNNDEESSDTANPLSSSSQSGRSSLAEGVRGVYGPHRDSLVERHFSVLVAVKILPAVISCFVMCGMLVGGNPAVFLPVVAAMEVLRWFLSSWLIYDDDKWREVTLERHFAIERLGLFFMLVLGEAVLHLCRKVDPDQQEIPSNQYIVLL